MNKKDCSSHEDRDKALFDSIAHDYLRKDRMESSRIARQLRLRQTLAAAKVPNSCVLLEVGCGGGFSAEYLSGMFSRYYGVDYSEQLIEYASQVEYGDDVKFVASNIKSYVPAEPVDVILMIGVLHHLDDITETLQLLYTMLKPGGVIVVNEPHPANILLSFLRLIRKKIDPGYSSDQVELSIQEMIDLYQSAGFTDVKMVPQGFFSTPFAEVIIGPQIVTKYLSGFLCRLDALMSKAPFAISRYISWNAIAVGRRDT